MNFDEPILDEPIVDELDYISTIVEKEEISKILGNSFDYLLFDDYYYIDY